ncbi:Hydrogenase maturation factor HoxV/HupK [hydrothermal vent metagenome]|uniref:Hydrogenase maturation factor HoxV/HupK n=1 Tax=hydrothermal vent metagenome TaxID=652676 RepID=A0A3B1B3K9_9ZZZZ
MGIEGSLNIAISTASGRVEQVSIESSRPVYASQVLVGKSVTEALKTLPVLFSICGTAQACAGVRACEQALGIMPADGIEHRREALVAMETVREHLWRILLDWPGFLDVVPEKKGMNDILALQREHRQVLTGGQDPMQLGGTESLAEKICVDDLTKQARLLLQQVVFEVCPAQWLALDTPAALQRWTCSATTVAARLLGDVMQQAWSDLGRCEVEALPSMDMAYVEQQMQDKEFIRQPQWHGDCRESTCLSRVDSPLLQQLRRHDGNGLLVRLVARLTELAQLSSQLSAPDCGTATLSITPQNPGIGQVAAARGQLLHRVQVQDERIARYQILAPTEWNFHPLGVVARSLASLQGEAGQMRQQAKLLINAIDPCVGYQLSIKHA